MSFRSWVYVFAVIGLTLPAQYTLAQGTSEDEPRQEEATTNAEQEGATQKETAPDYFPALEGIESAIRDLIAEEDKIAEESQRDREQRDLNAQESMADWAELMFYATGATVILTAIALWAIIRTLHHTRRAAVASEGMLMEAQKATDAALSARDTAHEANVAFGKSVFTDQRPWVYLEVKNVFRSGFFISTDTKSVGTFSSIVTVTVINTGKTPAHDVQIWVDAFDDKELDLVLEVAIKKTDQGKFYRMAGIIPPNSKIEFDSPVFQSFDNIHGWEGFSFQSKLFCSIRYGTDASKRENNDANTMQIFQIEVEDGGVMSTRIRPETLQAGGAMLNVRPAVGSMS